jgi:hypothetical protein
MPPVPSEARTQLEAAMAARIDAEAALAAARVEEQRVVRLVHLGGASVREIARVMGVSHQRVQQLVEAADDGRGWRRRAKASKWPTCSFCGAHQQDVRKLIAGPGVYVCDGCVRRARRGFTPQEQCSFCTKEAAPDLVVRGTAQVAICRECVDLCDEIIEEELGSR